MRSALEAFETELRSHAPAIASTLRPGLLAGGLAKISNRLDFQLPDEVRELFLWHDGTGALPAGSRAELFPGGHMLSLEEAIRALADAVEGTTQDESFVWNARWLPVFTDGMGSWYAVACAQPPHSVVNIYYVDLPDTHAGYPNLRHMVGTLRRLWRSGAYWQGESGAVEEDPRAVASIRRSEDLERPNLDRLIAALNDGPVENYLFAIDMMRTRLYPEAVSGLIHLLQTGTSRGRRAAAELLGSIGDPAAKSVLKSASENDLDDTVRVDAHKALGQLKGSR